MWELLQETLWLPNLLQSLLLLLMMAYWAMMICGALGLDFLNIDLDLEADVDVDVDADVDTDASAVGGIGPLHAMLMFFYVGKVPVMILLSLLVPAWWFASVTGNHYLNPGHDLFKGLAIAAGAFVLSLTVVKSLGAPVARLFETLDLDANAVGPIIGRECVLITSADSSRLGQAEIKTKAAPVRVNVLAREPTANFRPGETAVIRGHDPEKNVYFVASRN
jgi:hypothetical protein